jgi:hypothetical protein
MKSFTCSRCRSRALSENVSRESCRSPRLLSARGDDVYVKQQLLIPKKDKFALQ